MSFHGHNAGRFQILRHLSVGGFVGHYAHYEDVQTKYRYCSIPARYCDVACHGGKLEEPMVVSTVKLKERFPLFVEATAAYCNQQTSSLSEDNLESLIGCSANSLTEITPARQRFVVYRAVALFLGFKDRNQLPEVLEDSIKKTWSSPSEEFVGYKEG